MPHLCLNLHQKQNYNTPNKSNDNALYFLTFVFKIALISCAGSGFAGGKICIDLKSVL